MHVKELLLVRLEQEVQTENCQYDYDRNNQPMKAGFHWTRWNCAGYTSSVKTTQYDGIRNLRSGYANGCSQAGSAEQERTCKFVIHKVLSGWN